MIPIITGCPRTGTTALAVWLSTDPHLLITNELAFFEHWDDSKFWQRMSAPLLNNHNPALFKAKGLVWPAYRDSVIDQRLNGRDAYAILADAVPQVTVGDKYPAGYLEQLPSLLEKFPAMRALVTMRDGRAVIDSQIRAYDATPEAELKYWMQPDVERAAFMWIANTWNLDAAVGKVCPTRLHVVRYEHATVHKSDTVADIGRFLEMRLKCDSQAYQGTHIYDWTRRMPMDLPEAFENLLELHGYT